jgi:non-specific serine/threonine protein kinase
LARVARVRQELAEATTLLQEALRLAHGHWRLEVQWCLEDLAGVAVARNLPERAARLFGAAEALLERSDYGLPTIVKSDRESDLRAAREQLGDRAFEAAFAVGRERSLERAVAFALEASDEPGAGVEAVKLTPLQAEKAKYGGLTARERQVAALVARGMSNRAIAEELVVTLRTAEAHVTHILAKLSFNSRAQIAAWAVDRGLAQAPETLAEQMRGSTDG